MKNLLLLISITILCIRCTDTLPLILITDSGKIEGIYNADETIRIFKGIPYAAPPVGDLRWQVPQPAEAWEGIKPCKEFRASPIQNKPQPFYCWSKEFIAKPEPLSEDCLHLNVWTSAKSLKGKQPVFVWIYGGGLVSGSSNCDIYDGEEMAKQGVVFVSINYRVGALGFMAHPELTAASEHKASGNYGFLDQIMALKWVQNNIHAFGGDPNNITIAGQSAGAFSVNTLIASPLAKGLFHKAILQSGGLFTNRLQQNLSEAEEVGTRLMEVAGTKSIEELRQLPAEKIQILSNDTAVGRFGVTLDGYILPTDIVQHFEEEKHQQVPVMAGWVTGDGDFLGTSKITVATYKAEAKEQYGERAAEYLQVFPATTDAEAAKMKAKLALLHFAGMTPHLLSSFNTKPTFIYEFAHVPVDKPDFPNFGAFHTSEVPFALHNLHTWQRPWRPIDKDIEKMMSAYWVNFAKTGNPNGTDLPEWKTYDKTNGHILKIDTTTSTQKRYMKAEFDFLESVRLR